MPATDLDIQRIRAALAPADDAVIDQLVAELCGLHRAAALDFALRVGRLVLERLYGGDLDAWRARGVRDGSFRRLAERLDPLGIPGLSSSSLARALGTLELDARVGVAGRPQLNAAHVVAVLGLKPADQERLLGRAEAQDWTAAELKVEADRVRRASANPARTGRRPLPAFVKTVNRWERELAEDASFHDLDQLATLEDDDAERLTRAVAAMRERCDVLLGAFALRGGNRD